jgi:hypothetical protein
MAFAARQPARVVALRIPSPAPKNNLETDLDLQHVWFA